MAPGTAKAKGKASNHLKSAWPLLEELIRPRKAKIATGMVLMLVNMACSLVLPGSSKVIFDLVINQHRTELLMPIIGAVLAATLIQAITSFSLTQLLSKEGQRLIAELRPPPDLAAA